MEACERAVARPQTPFDGWVRVAPNVVPRLKPGLGPPGAEAHGAKRRCRAGVSFRIVLRRAQPSGWGDFNRHLPKLLAPLQSLERRARLGERAHTIDDRSQLSPAAHSHH